MISGSKKLQSPCARSGRALQLLQLQRQSSNLFFALGGHRRPEPSVKANYLGTLSYCQYFATRIFLFFCLFPLSASAALGSGSAWTSCAEYTEANQSGKLGKAIVAACDQPAGLPPARSAVALKRPYPAGGATNSLRYKAVDKRETIQSNQNNLRFSQTTGWAEL